MNILSHLCKMIQRVWKRWTTFEADAQFDRARRLAFQPLDSRRLFSADYLEVTAEFVYELNRLRVAPDTATGPSAEFELAHAPTQPLALNVDLQTMANMHAHGMATNGFFSHVDAATGRNANQRARDFGYSLAPSMSSLENNIELIAAGDSLTTPDLAIRELLQTQVEPTQSRRVSLLGIDSTFADHAEIGVGSHFNESSSLEHYWSISLGHESLADRFITGFVYEDTNANGRFDAGEGKPNTLIRSGALATTTNDAGQYSLPVGAGVHSLLAITDASDPGQKQNVRVEDQNVQVDFVLHGTTEVNYRTRSLWTHPTRHLDVNASGTIEPLDALLVINFLNRFGSEKLTLLNTTAETPYLDSNGDESVTPLDALIVINYLNRTSHAEGEALSTPVRSIISVDLADFWSSNRERNNRA